MNKSNLLIACATALMIAAPTVVKADTNWYILNAGAGTCDLASQFDPNLRSPYMAEQWMRRSGTYGNTDITRDELGYVTRVLVSGNNTSLAYFATADSCMIMRDLFVEKRLMGRPNELK